MNSSIYIVLILCAIVLFSVGTIFGILSKRKKHKTILCDNTKDLEVLNEGTSSFNDAPVIVSSELLEESLEIDDESN